jgi:hypothetical protein
MADNEKTLSELIADYFDGRQSQEDALERISKFKGGIEAVRDYRMIRILSQEIDQPSNSPSPDQTELISFWNEGLPLARMLEIERHLSEDEQLFDAYINLRMDDYVMEVEPSPEVSTSTLDMLLSNSKAPEEIRQTSAQSSVSEQSGGGWLSSIFDKVFPSRTSSWGAGLVAASIALLVLGIFNTTDEQNDLLFLISDNPNAEVRLRFRGATTNRLALTDSGEFKSLSMALEPRLKEAVISFSKNPKPNRMEEILSVLRDAIGKSDISSTERAAAVRSLAQERFSGLQIAPQLWEEVSAGGAEGRRVSIETVSVEKNESQSDKATMDVLFFSRD